jgi:hypothetical protein
MARLTLNDCELIAQRNRPWTFRLEFHGTTPTGGTSAKFWYATGRGITEAIEVAWGALGNLPQQYQVIDWTELQNRVAEKLGKGYQYADTPFIRMSAANLALLTAGQTTPLPPVAPVVAPVPPPAVVTKPAAPVVMAPVKPQHPGLLALGEPWSLIRALKLHFDGKTLLGYDALDEDGDVLFMLTKDQGLKSAQEYDLEVKF